MLRKEKLIRLLAAMKKLEELLKSWLVRQKNNPVLIGEPGVGKTAIIEGLASRIVKEDVPFSLKK